MPSLPVEASPAEFLAAVRAKYPDYNSLADHELASLIGKKYPEYRKYTDPLVSPPEQKPTKDVVNPVSLGDVARFTRDVIFPPGTMFGPEHETAGSRVGDTLRDIALIATAVGPGITKLPETLSRMGSRIGPLVRSIAQRFGAGVHPDIVEKAEETLGALGKRLETPAAQGAATKATEAAETTPASAARLRLRYGPEGVREVPPPSVSPPPEPTPSASSPATKPPTEPTIPDTLGITAGDTQKAAALQRPRLRYGPEGVREIEPPALDPLGIALSDARKAAALQETATATSSTPVAPPHIPTPQESYWARAKAWVRDKLPVDYRLWRVSPNHPLVTLHDQAATDLTAAMRDASKLPALRVTDPGAWVAAEARAYRIWKETGDAEAAYGTLPPEIRAGTDYLRKVLRPQEQEAAQFFREKPLFDEPFYVVPHVAEKDLSHVISLSRASTGLRSDIRTTLGAFEKPRKFPTMAVGMEAGEKYADPRLALWLRIWAGQKMVKTYQFIKNLEDNGILFRTEQAASEAMGGGRPYQVRGIPGGGEWWTTLPEYGQFIRDHLSNPHIFGALARVVDFGNRYLRSPNLLIPYPHEFKNIWYKFGLSGGKMTRLLQDRREYLQGSNPEMRALFERYMPFDPEGQMASDVFHRTLQDIQGRGLLSRIATPLTAVQRWSSRRTFSIADPAAKAARFKQYIEAGVEPQDAANRVNLDLVRYAMRSQAMNVWQSMPFNFFVPWRVGTVTSLIKSMRENPARAVLWVGAIDLLREELYRKTGFWLHTPIDYIEGPLYGLLDAGRRGLPEGRRALLAFLATTGLFGPGGQSSGYFWRNLTDAIATGKLDLKFVRRTFWGLAQIADPYGATYEFEKYLQDNDPGHLLRIFAMATLAAHNSVGNPPKRFGALIPESILPKSPEVQRGERLYNRDRMLQQRRELRPSRTRQERVLH